MAKILERIISEKMFTLYIDKIYEYQHGDVKSQSVETKFADVCELNK